MAPRRKASDLKLKSVWDETLVSQVVCNTKHRAKIWKWLINHPNQGLDEVPYGSWSVAAASVKGLKENFVRFSTKIVERNDSARGDSIKLLVELQDGHRVETVIMKHPGHATVCISSQIGCQMGCRFCATGTMGIIGNLTSGEIVEQIIYANNIVRIRNVVFMGMGEPLNNYDNVKLAVEFIVDNNRLSLAGRHVTVSTVGVLKSMQKLSAEMPYVSLAVSLHAPNQEVRLGIVPAASAHHIDKIMDAIDNHIESSRAYYCRNHRNDKGDLVTVDEANTVIKRCDGKRPNKITGLMIEYILIKDVNDREEHAYELANLLACRRDHILLNLIPYNPTDVAEDYEPPSQESVKRFHEICTSDPFKLHTRVRQEKGQDIVGACGQLALVKPNPKVSIENSENIDIENAAGLAVGSTYRTVVPEVGTIRKVRDNDPSLLNANGKISSNVVVNQHQLHGVMRSLVASLFNGVIRTPQFLLDKLLYITGASENQRSQQVHADGTVGGMHLILPKSHSANTLSARIGSLIKSRCHAFCVTNLAVPAAILAALHVTK